MRPFLRTLFVLVLLPLATSCETGPPEFDGSTEGTLRTSVVEMRSALNSTKRATFDSLFALILHDGALPDEEDGVTDTTAILGDTLRMHLTGRRLHGIRRVADSLRRNHLTRELEHTRDAIGWAETFLKDARRLRQLAVVRARWNSIGRDLGMGVALTLENGTDLALSRAEFEGALITPGRTIAWEEGEFVLELPGGLEPGERRTFHDVLQDWDASDAPEDAVLQLDPVMLAGPAGRPAAGSLLYRDTSSLHARLDSLHRKLKVQQAELETLTETGGQYEAGS